MSNSGALCHMWLQNLVNAEEPAVFRIVFLETNKAKNFNYLAKL